MPDSACFYYENNKGVSDLYPVERPALAAGVIDRCARHWVNLPHRLNRAGNQFLASDDPQGATKEKLNPHRRRRRTPQNGETGKAARSATRILRPTHTRPGTSEAGCLRVNPPLRRPSAIYGANLIELPADALNKWPQVVSPGHCSRRRYSRPYGARGVSGRQLSPLGRSPGPPGREKIERAQSQSPITNRSPCGPGRMIPGGPRGR